MLCVHSATLHRLAPVYTRATSHCHLQIINSNTPIPEAGEDAVNVLSQGGRLAPGILFAALLVAETDVHDILARLRANGVAAVLDSELEGWWEGCPPSAVCWDPERPTVILRDLCGTIMRIVPSQKPQGL